MKLKSLPDWVITPSMIPDLEGTQHINFGPVQLMCYPDPLQRGYRYKIGSNVSNKIFKSMNDCKINGLRKMEKLAQAILEGVRALPEYGPEVQQNSKKPEPEVQLDQWTVSILNMEND